MLDTIRKGQRWLTAIFIFAIGIVFVFFLGLDGQVPGAGPGSGFNDESVVMLDDNQIRVSDFQRARDQQQQRLQNALGDQFDPDSMSSFLDSQTLQAVVNQLILSQSARDLGLLVSAEEVKNLLRNDPSLRDANGRFDQATFDSNVKWTYGSQANFLSTMQRDLLQQKMFELLLGHGFVSDAEALSAAKYKSEEVQIAYVALEAGRLPESKRPDQARVQSYFETHRSELQAAYDAEPERFSTPERVELRHILFKPSSGDDSATANRERAEQALARLHAGEDFAALALELSDDTSSKTRGGALGLIGRGDVSPALEAVVFDLAIGSNSEIIEGPEGLHIVRVDAKTEAGKQSFELAGVTLATEAVNEEVASQLANELASAVSAGKSLEVAARAADLSLERTSFFTRRRDGFVPGLDRPSAEIISTAFTLGLNAPSSPTVFEVGKQKVLIQLLDRHEPDADALQSAVASAKQTLEAQKRNSIMQAWIDSRREEFESQGRLQINASVIAGG